MKTITTTVAALMIALIAAASLAFSPGTGSTTPNAADGISAAELIDLQAVADQKGMSLQAAIDRYAWNDDFAAAVSEIREAVPGAFTGAEITDAGHAWVAFAGSAPKAALSMIGTFTRSHSGVSIEVRADKGFTEVELEKAIKAAHFAVYDSPKVLNANTSFDFATGKIETIAQLKSTASATVLDDLRAAAVMKITDTTRTNILNGISNSVVRFDGQVLSIKESNIEHLGGEEIKIVIGNTKYICTSGFGVESSSGTRGISTAGHCPDSLEEDGSNLTLQGFGYEGFYGDFQWHTGTQSFSNGFYAGNNSETEVDERDVINVGSPSVGQTLCRNGIMSHRDCQQVRKINVCNDGVCSLVQMGAHLSTDGDSGGPVYWGNTAYGIHQGMVYDPFEPFGREVFSRADRIYNALGIFIATD